MKVPGFWILSFICLTIFAKSIADEPRVVCYYTNWSIYRPGNAKYSPQNINPYLCTHLIYAFGGFTKDNTLQPFDKYQDIEKGGYAKFTGLKTYNKNLKTLLAIGGWNEASSRFSPLVGDAERRRTFVKNAIKYLRQNHFDGLDLDWEYPTFRDGGKLKDRVNYAQFVQELREEFDRESSKTGRPRLLLTLAIPAGVDKIDQGYDVVKLNQYLDWFNVLTYDYHDSFEPATNHHAPLYSLEEDNEYNYDAELNIDFSVKHLIKAGADRQKLVLGIPTYGRSYTLINPDATEIGAPTDGPGEPGDATREKGFLAYYEICQHIKNDDDWTVMHPNDNVMGPYLYKDDQWISYDDEKMARKKAQYAAKNGLGGIMFWAIDTDDFRGTCTGKPYPLIEAAKEGLYNALGVKSNDSKEVLVKTTTRNRNRSTKKPVIGNEASSSIKDNFTRRRKPSSSASTSRPTTTTEPSIVYNSRTTTPEPPTTPDPGSDFKCEDEGFFPHPRDCKKYFWCLDSGPSNLGIVAHQFTCPSGLVFNKQADSCDYARNVACSKTKPSTTTTTRSPPTTTSKTTTRLTTTPRTTTFRTTTSRPTTTSTTTPAYEYDDEEYDDEIENTELERDIEDPKVIKELIDLIKKAGGLDKLEKHLKFSEDNLSVFDATKPDKLSTTQATFSKSLYDKVLIRKPENRFVKTENTNKIKSDRDVVSVTPKVNNTRYSSIYQNSRPSPQNAGLEELSEFDAFLKEKPQYVTIQRHRSTTEANARSDDDDSQEEGEEEYFSADTTTRSVYQATAQPQYVNIQRNRATTESTIDDEDDSEEIVQNPFSRPIESITQSSQYATINRRRKPDNDDSVQVAISTDTESSTQYATINRGGRPTSSELDYVSIKSNSESGIQYSTINRGRRPDSKDSAETPSSAEIDATTQYSTINRRRRPENIDTTEISSPSDIESTTQYTSINRRRRPESSETTSDTESTTQYSTINRRGRPEKSDKVEISSESDTGAITKTAEVSSTVNSRTRTRYQSISRGSAATTSSEGAKKVGEKSDTQRGTTDKNSESREDGDVEVPVKRVLPALLNSNTKYQTVSRNQIKSTILETTLANDSNTLHNNTTDLIADNATQKETPPPPQLSTATPDFNNNLIGINLNNTNIELTTNQNLTTPTNTINYKANQINTDITFTLKSHHSSNETLNDLNDVQGHTVENVTEFVTTKLSSPRPFGFQKPNKTILLNQTRAPKVSQVENLEPNKTISNPIINEQDNLGKTTVIKQEIDIKPLVDRTRFSFSSVTSPKPVIELQTVNDSDHVDEDQSSLLTVTNSNRGFSFGSNVNNNQGTEYKGSFVRGGFRYSSETNPTVNTDIKQTTDSNQNLFNTQQEPKFQTSFDRRGNRISSSSGSNTNTDSFSSHTFTQTQNTNTNLGANVNTQEATYKSSFDLRGSRITPSTSPIASINVEPTDSQNLTSNLGGQEVKSQASFDRRGFRISSSSSPNANADSELKSISSQTLIESRNSTTNVGTNDAKVPSSYDRRGSSIAPTTGLTVSTDVEQTDSKNLATNMKSNFSANLENSQTSVDSKSDIEETTTLSQTLFEGSNFGTQAVKYHSSTDIRGSKVTLTSGTIANNGIEQPDSKNFTSNLNSNFSAEYSKSQSSFDRGGFRISSSTSPKPEFDGTTTSQIFNESSIESTDVGEITGTQKLNVQSSYDRRGSRITTTTTPIADADIKQAESQNLTVNLGSEEAKSQATFDRRGFRISSSSNLNANAESKQKSSTSQTIIKSRNSTTNIGTGKAKVQTSYDRRVESSRITPTKSTDVEHTEAQNLTINFSANTEISRTSENSKSDFEETSTLSQALLEYSTATSDLSSNIGTEEVKHKSSTDIRGSQLTLTSGTKATDDIKRTDSKPQESNLGFNFNAQNGNSQSSFDRGHFRISSSTSPEPELEGTTISQILNESSIESIDVGENVSTQEVKVQSSYDRKDSRITTTTTPIASTDIEQTDSRNLTNNLGSEEVKSVTSFDRQRFKISSSINPNSNTDSERKTTSSQSLLESRNVTTNLESNVETNAQTSYTKKDSGITASQSSTSNLGFSFGAQNDNSQSSFDRSGLRISASASPKLELEETTNPQILNETSIASIDLGNDVGNQEAKVQSSYDRRGSRVTSTPSTITSTDVEQTDSQNLTTTLKSNFSTQGATSQSSFDRRGFRISSSTSPQPDIPAAKSSYDRRGSRITTTTGSTVISDIEPTISQNLTRNLTAQEVKSQTFFDRRGFRISSSSNLNANADSEQKSISSQTLVESRTKTIDIGSNVGIQEVKVQSSYDRRGSRITPTTRPTESTNVNLSDSSFNQRGFKISSSTIPKSDSAETTTSSEISHDSSYTTTDLRSDVGTQQVKSRKKTTILNSNRSTEEVKYQSSVDRRGFRISTSSTPKSNTDFEDTSNSTKELKLNVNTQEEKLQSSYDRRGFRITPSTSPTTSVDIEQTTIYSFDSSSDSNYQKEQVFKISSSTSPETSTDIGQTTLSSQTLIEFKNTTNLDADGTNVGQKPNATIESAQSNIDLGREGFEISSVTDQNLREESETTTTNSEQSTISSQTLLESENSAETKPLQIASSSSPITSIDVEKFTISSQSPTISTIEEPKLKPTIRRGFRVSTSTTQKPTVDVGPTTNSNQLLFQSRNLTTSLSSNITTQEPKPKSTTDRRRFRIASTVTNRPAIVNTDQTTYASQLVTEPRSTTVRTITRNRGNRRFYNQPTVTQESFTNSPFNTNLTRKYRPIYEETQEPVNYNTLLNRDVRPSNLDELSSLTAFDFNRQSYSTRNPSVRRRTRPPVTTTTTQVTQAPSSVSTESYTSTESSTTQTSTEARESYTVKPARKQVIRKLRPITSEVQEAVDYNSLLNRNVRPATLDELSSLTSIDFNRQNYNTGSTVVRRRPRPTVVKSTTTQDLSSAPTESNIGTDNSRIYKRPVSRNRPSTTPSTTTTTISPVILPKPVSHDISSQLDPPYESSEISTNPPITLSLVKSFDFGFTSRKPNSTDQKVFENDFRGNSTINVTTSTTTTTESIDTTTATTEQILPNDTTTVQLNLDEQNSLNVTSENNQTTNNVTNTTHNVPLPETKTRPRVRTVKRLRDPIKHNAINDNTIEIISSTETLKAINFSLSNPTIETIVNEGFNFQPTDPNESDTIPLRGRLSTTTNTVESESQTDSTIGRRRQFQSRISTTPTTTLITESNSETESQVSGNSSSTNGSRFKVVNRTFRRRPGTKLEINVNSTLADENVEPTVVGSQIESSTETRKKFGVSEKTNSIGVSRFNARTRRPVNNPEVNSKELESVDSVEEISPLVDKEVEPSTQKSSFIPPRRAFAQRTFTTAATTVNIEANTETVKNVTSTSEPKSTIRPRFKVNRTFTRRPFTQLEVTSNEPVNDEDSDDKEIESNIQIETSTEAKKKYATRFSANQVNTESDNRVSGNRFKVRTFTRKPVTSEPDNGDETSEENVALSEEELDPGFLVESTTARRRFVPRPFASSATVNAQVANETEIRSSENTESSAIQRNSSLPVRRKFISRVSTTPASLNTQTVLENKNSNNTARYNLLNRPRGPFTKPEIKPTSTTEIDNLEENFTSTEAEVDSVTLETATEENFTSTEVEFNSVTLETVTDNQVTDNDDLRFVTSTPITTVEDKISEENISSSTEELTTSTTKEFSSKPRRKIKIIKATTTKRPQQNLASNEELDLANSEESLVSNNEELENITTPLTLVETSTTFPNLEINPQDEENLPLDDTELDFNALKTTTTSTTLANEVTESRVSENITPTSGSRFKVLNRTFSRRPALQGETSSKASINVDNIDDEEIESNGQKNTSTQSQRKYVSRTSTSQTNTETESRINVPRYKIRAFTRKPTTTTLNTPDDDDVSSDENLLSDNEEIESSSRQPDASISTRRSFRPRISSTTPTPNTRVNGEANVNAARLKIFNRTFARKPTTQVEVNSNASSDGDDSSENSALDDDEIESNTQPDVSAPTRRTFRPRISTTTQKIQDSGVGGSESINTTGTASRFKVLNRTFTRKPATQAETSSISSVIDENSEENVDDDEIESNTQPDVSTTTKRTFRPIISRTSQTNEDSEIDDSFENDNSTNSGSRFKVFNRNFTRKPATQNENSFNSTVNDENSEENVDEDEFDLNTQSDVPTTTRRTFRPIISTTSQINEESGISGSENVNTSSSDSRFKVFNSTFTSKQATQDKNSFNSTVDGENSEENIDDEEIESNTQSDSVLPNHTVNSQTDEETESINSTSTSRFKVFNRNFTLKSTEVGITSNASIDGDNSEENATLDDDNNDDDDIGSSIQSDSSFSTRKPFRLNLSTSSATTNRQGIEETEIQASENRNATTANRFKIFNRNFTRKLTTQVEINSNSTIDDDDSEENLASIDGEIESNTQPDSSAAPTRRSFRPRISTTPSTVNNQINETDGSDNINSTSSGSRFKVFNRTFALKPASLGLNSNAINNDGSNENLTVTDQEINISNLTFISNGTDTDNNSEENEESKTQSESFIPTKRTFIPRISTTPSTLASLADSEIRVSETGSSLKFSLGNRTRKPFGQQAINLNRTDESGDSVIESVEEEEIGSNTQIETNKEQRKYVSRITTTAAPPPLRFKVFNRQNTRKPSTTPQANLNDLDDDNNSEEVESNTQIGSENLNSPTPKYKTFTRKPFTRPQINENENTEDSQELESNSQIDSTSQTGRKYVSRVSTTQTNSETETRIFGSSNSFNAPRYGVINRTRKPLTRPEPNGASSLDDEDDDDDDDNLDENLSLDDEDNEDESNSRFSNAQSNSGNGNLPIPRYSTIERTVTRKPFTRLQINVDNEDDETENSEESQDFDSNSQGERKYVSQISQSNSETETRISGSSNSFNAPRYGVINRTRKPFTRPEINSNSDDVVEENSYSDTGENQARNKFVPRISNSPTGFNGQSKFQSGSRVSGNVPKYQPTPTRPSQNIKINTNDDFDEEDYDEENDGFEENLTGNDESISSFSKFDTSTSSIRKFKPRISINSVKPNIQSTSESSLPSGYRNKAIFQRKPYTRPVYTNEQTDSDNSEESVTIKTDDDESNTEREINNNDEVAATTIATGEFISESDTPSTLNNNFTQTVYNSSGSEQTNSSFIKSLWSNIVGSENETESEFESNRNDSDARLVNSSQSISFNTPAPPTAPASQKVINKPFSGTLNNFSKSQSTQITGSQNSPVQSTKIDSNKFIPFHLRQQNTFNKIGVLTTTPPSLAPLPKVSTEEIETTTGSISYTDYTNIQHSTTLDTSTPITSTLADLNLYSTLISQESTTTFPGDDIDKVTEISISPLKKSKPTTTSKPTTLHHIFAVDYDSAEEDRNNGTNLGNSTELNNDDDEGGSQEVSAEEISQRLEKLVEINRIVEIYSKQRSNNGNNDLSSNSNELIVEKIPTLDKIGEISRWISVKLQNHNTSATNNIQEILRNITKLEETLNSTAVNTTFDSKMIFDVETSTIPLEGLFDKNKKNLNDNEVIDYQTTKPTPLPPSSSPLDSNPINLDSFTGATSFGIAAATIPSHNYVQQLRPESHEANPLVISIANLDQVVLSKSDKIDKKISFQSSAIGTTESTNNQLTFSSNPDLTN